MALVVAVEHHSAGPVPNHHDDVVVEDHRQPKLIDVEGPRGGEVGNEQDQALEAWDAHHCSLFAVAVLHT